MNGLLPQAVSFASVYSGVPYQRPIGFTGWVWETGDNCSRLLAIVDCYATALIIAGALATSRNVTCTAVSLAGSVKAFAPAPKRSAHQ